MSFCEDSDKNSIYCIQLDAASSVLMHSLLGDLSRRSLGMGVMIVLVSRVVEVEHNAKVVRVLLKDNYCDNDAYVYI